MKHKKVVIVLLIILVAILGILGYLIKENKKNNISNNGQNNNVNTNSKTSDVKVEQRVSIDVGALDSTDKSYDIKTLNGSIKLAVTFPKDDKKVSDLLTLNGKTLINNYDDNEKKVIYLRTIGYIEVYNDIIIVYIIEGKTAWINIYNLDGKLVKEIKNFTADSNYYRVYDTSLKNPITIDKKTIKFIGTRNVGLKSNSYIIAKDVEIDLCDIKSLDKYQVTDDSIVEGIFKFNYSGDENFSDITLDKIVKTVKDYKEC